MNFIDFKMQPPVRFNCWKHHAGYIRQRIKEVNSIDDFNSMLKEMLSIGNSQMDLYTGDLSPAEIVNFIRTLIEEKNINSYPSYFKWIHNEGKDYRMISLKDNSKWTLRIGNEDERYVHLHPGRYSVNSIRVKATALKTAAAALLWKKLNNLTELDLSVINYVRKNFISAPPVKAIPQKENRGLMKIVSLLDR
ncbi:MAG TPA: hypothetical protein VLM39_12200 [Ignavibacteriaceae bacterium]|nr:hypothetical protein [Ignavibacteriaceae bacterium]